MTGRGISVPAVALAGAGAVTVYAALKGVSVGSGFRTLLGGKAVTGPGLGSGVSLMSAVSPVTSDSAVASAAGRYVGAGVVYRWGGGSPTRGWDCSGFVNYVVCHDLGLAIPGYAGGRFDGSGHGPVTMQWATWSGAVTIPRGQVAAGDLVVWPTQHMGIAADNQQMINCPGPNGTAAPVLSRIDGAAGGPLVCRRLRAGM